MAAPDAAQGGVVAITRDAVGKAVIADVYDVPVTLTGGIYEGAPLVAGGAARPTLRLLDNLVRIAKVDDSTADAAVALLAENSGGSGERLYLSVIGVRGGAPRSLATTLVGDRTKVRSVSVADRKIVLDVVEAGPNDPACCPTQVARKTYVFGGGRLSLAQSGVTGPLSMALLAGGEWTVIEIDRERVPADAKPPTVNIEGDRIAGFSGCNRFTGSFKEPTPGTLTMGPVAGTRMACPEPAAQLERRFLAALGRVTQYSFVSGRVSMSGLDGGAMRSLLLTREP